MEENEKSSEEFKFSVDEERPVSLFNVKREHVWRENRQVDSLSRRVTMISFFFFCVIAATSFLGYRHVEKMFAQLRHAETGKAQALSQELESKLASLSVQYEKLEESLTRKVSPVDEVLSDFEKKISALKNDLNKAEKRLDGVNGSKADKTALAKMDNTLGPLRKDVDRVSGDVTSLSKKLSEELAKSGAKGDVGATASEIKSLDRKLSEQAEKLSKELAGLKGELDSAKKDFNKLRAEIATLLGDTTDNKTLDKMLKEQDERHKENLILINENLDYKEKKIKSIQKKLEGVEKSLEKLNKTSSRRQNLMKTPSSGNIVEQDIQ